MLRYEIKKVFSKSKNRIAVIVLFVILVITSILTINKVEFVDENGNSSVGISASRDLREAKNQWAGYLTTDTLSKALDGFGHSAILSHADTVIEAVKSGAIRHFFLVAGCDGAKPGRNYYTEFVKQTPSDSIVLTLACGKFRFNDLNLGEIGGLPRLMDMGQCNDAYGAIQVAIALADAFGCSVNELPLSFVLSWYEQKAVCILLTLLHLGIKNIRLGPSLPAFLSPNILNFLVENYGIAPITTPEEDIKVLLKQ